LAINDPGFFTDSTGDGMAAATDVRLATQNAMKETMYNGSGSCKNCGYTLTPVEALYSELCPTCTRRKAVQQVKGRMA